MPRLYGTKLYSKRAADAHFWMATVGILLYVVAMWVSGVSQGLLWRATNPDGTLMYPGFVETLLAIWPMYVLRVVGGGLYLVGFFLMAWNLWKTARSGAAVDGEALVVVEVKEPGAQEPGWGSVLTGYPLLFALAILAVTALLGWAKPATAALLLVLLLALGTGAAFWAKRAKARGTPSWFALVEGRPLAFTALTLIAVLVGGVAELLPTILVKHAVPHEGKAQQPYSALELQGRDLYVREGCYTCHSQMIRPMAAEVARYGEPSRAEESIYDHPFQWGSKRTGPDLARVGGKYPNLWHYTHMMDPRATSPGSNMPSFAWLEENTLDLKAAPRKLALMQKLGVPYTNEDVDFALQDQQEQAELIAADLEKQGVELAWDSEMVALIAYLQRLGREPQFVPEDLQTDEPAAQPSASMSGGQP
jgi:cytochrome c oxidase cbb3-type subunit I/II